MTTPREKTHLILTVEGVNKTFDGFKAITNLNFYLDRGELRTVIGPNGAGKSTFFDLITGRTKPDTGKIEFGWDTDLTALNEYEINRLGIGRKFQTPSVYGDHTVWENLLLSLKGPRGVFATLFHRTRSEQRDRIDELLTLIRLDAKRDWLAGKHSIVVVEHDMAFVKQIARDGKVTVLHQGTVLCEGKFDEVQSDTKVREVYLGRGKHGTR